MPKPCTALPSSEGATRQSSLPRSSQLSEMLSTSSEELALALSKSDHSRPPTRKAIMSAIDERSSGVSETVKNAILLITDHGRASLLPRIAGVLTDLADERAGKLRAEITSATELTEPQVARLTAALEKLTGRKISLTHRVDASLVGGVVTRIGDTVYDGSVRTRIDELRQSLLPS